MIGRRAIIGLSLLSMLVFCAVAAPSAFATKGTTQFTCKQQPTPPFTGDWKDAHCTEEEKGKSEYEHAVIKQDTETAITVSNKNTANKTTEHTTAVLHAIVGGLKATVTCTKVHGTGTQTNRAGPPMKVDGTVTTEFSECDALLNEKLCESVNEGKAIITKATTTTPADTMEVKFEEDKEAFAKFNIKCAGKNFEIKATGSATGIPKGATIEFTDASTTGDSKCTGNGLCVGGQPASFEAIFTTTMSTTEPGISLTTTEP